jgi:hypothetical protein
MGAPVSTDGPLVRTVKQTGVGELRRANLPYSAAPHALTIGSGSNSPRRMPAASPYPIQLLMAVA